MPRMELRGVEEGNPFYYNTEGGGALSGFGTTRLYNTGSNLTINFDSSNAHVDNDGSNVKIYNNHNNNMVYNGGTNVEIYSSGSFRELDNVSGQVTIYTSGNGDNCIANNGSNVSINTDAGNDFVWNDGGSYVTINNGAGNDTVNMVSGSNTTINMGSGDDFVENAGTDMEINGGADKDTIAINSGSNILANAGSGNDTIWCTSDCSSVTINCGDGDDYVDINTGASNVTIRSGNGSDRISNGGNDVLIELEGDNNFVKTTGSNVTIRSSSGSDYVNVNAGVMNIPYIFEYADGGGHDVVTKDVQIYLLDNAQINGFYIEGNDVIYNVGNGSIKILDGADVEDSFFINVDDPNKPSDNPDDDTTTGVADPVIYDLYAQYRDYYNENVPLLIGEIKETVQLNPENTENDFSHVIDAIEDYYGGWANLSDRLSLNKGLADISSLIDECDNLVECMKKAEKYFDVDAYQYNKKIYDYAEKWHLNNLGNDLKGRFFYWQYHTPKPTPENFVSEINGFEKIKNTLASHGTTWDQKKQIIGNVINKNPTDITNKNSVDITKNKIGKVSTLNKVGVVLSAGVVAANIADSWGEITNSIDSNASLVENISNFGNKFKAQNHEKYDNLNTSLIDLGLGIAAVGVGVLAGSGIATGLAVTVGFMFLNVVAKTAYYAYQHEKVDIGKTFWKNFNPLGGGYASSNDLLTNDNKSDIIHLISGTVKSTVASGEDLMVNFETNTLTIKNAANLHVSHITGNDVVPILKYGDNYNYTGGSRTIQNYSQNEQINLASDFTGIGLDDNNFYVNSSSGTLTIQNSRDKVISYGTADGILVAYSYMASEGGTVDGRGFSEFEIIIGADNADNQIYAGSGGSSLWGGNGGNDTLTGGESYDEFFFAIGSGGDVIQNAGDNDMINLLGVTLNQITVANVSEFSVHVTLADGSYLNVEGNSNVGYKVEGKVYACNQSIGEWYEK